MSSTLFILYINTHIYVHIYKHIIYTNIINKNIFVICVELPVRSSHTEHKQSNSKVKS